MCVTLACGMVFKTLCQRNARLISGPIFGCSTSLVAITNTEETSKHRVPISDCIALFTQYYLSHVATTLPSLALLAVVFTTSYTKIRYTLKCVLFQKKKVARANVLKRFNHFDSTDTHLNLKIAAERLRLVSIKTISDEGSPITR
jgi:hypothetical protein